MVVTLTIRVRVNRLMAPIVRRMLNAMSPADLRTAVEQAFAGKLPPGIALDSVTVQTEVEE